MKQLLQDARSGDIEVVEVPAPQLFPGCVLVRVAASLVSAGTEKAASAFARKNLLQKAAARPDLVRDMMAKVRRDGLLSAMQVARRRLDQPVALGYSSAGTVIAVADQVSDLRLGDRVACAGAGYAVHAEFACVPRLLVAKIPGEGALSFDEAAFTTLGAVALHGIRTADAKLGDVVAVIGLGLVGQLTVQLLKAAGCRVFGFDLVQERADLAQQLGADRTTASREAFADLCQEGTSAAGVDSVLITADTASSDPVNLAAALARDRAAIVAVGAVGMNIDRRLYYGKELDFRVSRSYGPGRYDAVYEQKGRDYPIGYVRWTETRNMEAFLQFLAEGKLRLEPLISHRFPVESAGAAYDLIMSRSGTPSLGVLLTYHPEQDAKTTVDLVRTSRLPKRANVTLSLLGAGNFATSTLLPALRGLDSIDLLGVCTSTGVHARHAAKQFDFRYCTTDQQQILKDTNCDAVVIATRHQLHAQQVMAALQAEKHVFCEKPLCLQESELSEILRTYAALTWKPVLTVGFNRRFAPMALRLRSFFSEVQEPLILDYRVNAGALPQDHWVNDPEQGGGRTLGELCHFVDLLIFLTGSVPVRVYARALGDMERYGGESVSVLLDFENGSHATLNYVANGDRVFSKERLEVFGGGSAAALEDFRRLELVRHGRREVVRARWRRDKGHNDELRAFVEAVRNGTGAPISLHNIVATTLTTFRIKDCVASGDPVNVDVMKFLSNVTNGEMASSVPA
ncbi:MAG TPA: bi-domain-containing oxidoreductase [Terriglobales bacterium]|nr:bi-domain-containing oxidoreductase [Terriglobales bacterium]